ncbi:MAG: cell division protein FtsL [Pseudomonadota bacterium]
MLRFLTVGSVLAAFASAFVLYATTYETRKRELALTEAQKARQALMREIATLKAERAFLSRPERIAPLARDLGMRPASGRQFERSRPTAVKRGVMGPR